jgi:acyl-CoA reductase-like NAD-dependent aldehyde dehydrogenase
MMGPLVSQKQLAKVTELVESAKTAGARIVTGGARIDKPGFFFPPTLISDVDPSMRVMREEIFGPVVCATPFKDIASVMPQVNDTEFGLAAYIWTRDIVTARCSSTISAASTTRCRSAASSSRAGAANTPRKG